ncbi:MAG: helicase-related protein [Planctomycetota bacterium]
MLEYLLLRPKDSPLFNAKWWEFIVLDEAHQYRGSRGIEMAMLLRRLKQRLREDGRLKPFRCIATSATLASGEKDKKIVADFANSLFGEIFKEEDVIFGETESYNESGSYKLQFADYSFLKQALNNDQSESNVHLVELLSKYGITYQAEDEKRHLINKLLLNDNRAKMLKRQITGQPLNFKKVANQLFDELLAEKRRITALSDLVQLLIQAEDPGSKAPLLSIRYHQFLRSLEGAFVSYASHKNEKNVFLDRKSTDIESLIFEVALCRECGQHYFVGKIKNRKLVEAIRDPSREDFGVTFFRPLENNEIDIQGSKEPENMDNLNRYLLCMQCGEITKHSLECDHNNFLKVIKEKSPNDEDRKDQIAKCGACGYSAAGRDPVQEVVHGTDGPNAVIATALYQNLKESQKKILAFADSRQEAAFFAWYLEESYKDIVIRNSIQKATQKANSLTKEGLSLNTLANYLANDFGFVFKRKESDDELTIQTKIWSALYREFLTDEQRLSLEGVGLLRYSIKWPEWYNLPSVLEQPPWLLKESESLELMFMLLNFMRMDKAVELRTTKSVTVSWSDLGIQAKQMRICTGSPRRPKGVKNWYVRSWDGKSARRANYLAKILIKLGVKEEKAYSISVETLRALWDFFRSCDEDASFQSDRLIIPFDGGKRLNPDWWRLHMIEDKEIVFQCDTCNRIQNNSVKNICPRFRCPGTLQEISLSNLSLNHYRNLYLEDLPGSLRVEEHTAQLDNERAREFQSDFKKGKIHVLSCSTTFELGVDLGDLNTIFLRNVPPEAFNYVQRVGRAGRRSGYPGYAITYCRRVPHDLYHYAEPQRMLSGKVKPPVLSLKNEKIITRHIIATAMSYFFRTFPERFINVETLFKNLEDPSGVEDFHTFLTQNRKELEKSLLQVVPPEAHDSVGLKNDQWINKLCGEQESKFYKTQIEISSDYNNVIRLEKEAIQKRDYRTAQWAQKRADTIAREDALSFLSRKAVIPKYGFPVDVVDLDTQRIQTEEARSVSLQRDLSIAISEFAPTSKLIANKKEWTSFGIKKVAEKEWDRRRYKRCLRHNYFLSWKIQEKEPSSEKCCNQMIKGEFIVPQFGFITSRQKPKKPSGRTPKVFTTKPYFVRTTKPEPGILDFNVVKLTKASPGLMAVLCDGRRGRGFYICKECGTGFRNLPKPPHKTPYGGYCKGTLSKQVSLGYEFTTDVLQLQFVTNDLIPVQFRRSNSTPFPSF